jgi:hypothetical protein
MTRPFAILGVVLLISDSWLLASVSSLPGFAEFQRIDRARRQTGQMMTDDLLRLSTVDPSLILKTAEGRPELSWGAAEFLKDWPQRRMMYERALAATGTNVGIVVRLACAAAKHGDDVALVWLREAQKRDNDNTAPWIAELWWLRQHERPMTLPNAPAVWTANFRDYSVEASRARIRLLEAAGYSPYAARRLGISADSPSLAMARDLARQPVDQATASLLMQTARAMQHQPPFLLSELIGQTIERTLLLTQHAAAYEYRSAELEKRREQLMALVADIERNAVDLATEPQMVEYYNSELDKGEEAAMKLLLETVGNKP